MNLIFRAFISLIFISCSDASEEGAIPSDYIECDYINEKVINYDLFEDYFSLTLNYGYTPDFARDSIMNDYHFLKFKNDELNGIYVIIDANTRYKTNKVIPLDEVSKKIISILEEYVKPAVASDGGNILFESYKKEDKSVNVILQGACSGCPSSTFTLKNGIENMLKEMLPGKILKVNAVNG